MKRQSLSDRGFTLIELLIVMAIIALVIGIGSYTYISQLRQIKLRNDVREFNSSLQLARMRTLASGINHGVAADPATGRFIVFVDCDADERFSDNNSDLGDNRSVANLEACQASAYDPILTGQSVQSLNSGNTFFAGVGDENYIVFNSMGQAVQGPNNLVAGDIVIHGVPDNGVVDVAVIHISSSGLTQIRPLGTIEAP
jgi:prepilin-type N-terminal cleavage/methylation domain-containing protein